MQIITQEVPPFPGRKEYTGDTVFSMSEKKKLIIDTTGEDGKILEIKVPDGKSWKVYIKVNIIET